MDDFCDSEFWNASLTWTSGVLEFTSCFQDTVLHWTPSLILSVFSLVNFYYIKSSRYKDIPWSFFNLTIIAILIVLICLSLIDLIFVAVLERAFIVDIANPFVSIVTFVSK